MRNNYQSSNPQFRNQLLKLAAAEDKAAKSILGWAGGHADKLLAAGLMGGGTLIANKIFKKPPTLGSQIKNSMGTALGFGLAGTALGAGVLAANKGVGALVDPIVKQRSFEKMLEANPSLKNEDKTVTHRSFDTLYRFNPDMAKDPNTAGSFVRRAAMFKDEGIQSADVKMLAEIRKNMSEAKKGSTGFLSAGNELYGFRDKD
jgi:hypothetical protein